MAKRFAFRVRNRLMLASWGVVLFILTASPVRAHESGVVTPGELWHHWELSPAIIVPLLFAALLYARGVAALVKRQGNLRGVTQWQALAFFGGLVAAAAALISPLDALSSALFSAHMAQHLLLVMIAAPLLALGFSPLPLFLGMPSSWRKPVARWQRHPSVQRWWRLLKTPAAVWVLHTAALWFWHLPGPYQAALQNEFLHALEHISFLGTGILYWMSLARPKAQAAYGIGVVSIFLMATQSGLLGALISLARTPWYPAYAETAVLWGLTPLEDQQIAGLLMWLPGSVIYVLSAGAVLTAWLGAVARRVEAREARTAGIARQRVDAARFADANTKTVETGGNA